MTTESLASSTHKAASKKASAKVTSAPPDGRKQAISPAQRWLLISENVYARAQKRGFVGGDPLEDLLAAEQEIDAAYDTDFAGVFTLTDAAEITEQFKGLFASYGFDHHNIDNLLDGHHEALERLASFNRQLIDSTSGLAAKQTDLLQDVASEAVKTLQSFTQGWIRPEGVFKQAELSMQAIDNALSHFQDLTSTMAGISEAAPSPDSGNKNIQGAVVKAYQGKSLKELTEAPVAALKGISKALGGKLGEVLAIRTIRDMATHKPTEWASGIVLLADAEVGSENRTAQPRGEQPEDETDKRKNLQAVANGPITKVQGISKEQAKLLRDAFHIQTVRDLAGNRLFSVARAIVMLADSDNEGSP